MVFIPKGGSAASHSGYEAQPSQFRPLTLSNSCQKLVAKAFGASLERIAATLVHPAQRGFLHGRKMMANVLETQLALEEAAIFGLEPRALVLFDVASAFPSAEWEWIWRCLDAMGVPRWLSMGLRRTYGDTRMAMLFNGEVFYDIMVVLRRGIKQGCPASGALWALLVDPIVRRLVASLPPRGYARTCFADDLATALGNATVGLRVLIPVLLEMRLAAGLVVHASKTQLLNFSDRRSRRHGCCWARVRHSDHEVSVAVRPPP